MGAVSREASARILFAKKPKEWQEQQLAAFEESGKLIGPFRKAYAKHGLESPMIAALFHTTLYGTSLTKPHETDLNAYKA